MRKRRDRPEDIKKILSGVIGKIKKRDPGKKERILKAWQRVVGPKARGHSRPVSVRRKVLTVEVDSSTWLYELSLRKKDILKNIQEELRSEKIEDLRFRMGDIT